MIKQWAKKKKNKKQKAWLVCKKIKLSFFSLQCLAFTALNEWGCSARASHRRERAFSFLPAAQRRDFCLSEGGERTMWRNINLLFCAKLIRITSLASVKKPWSHHSGSVCIFLFYFSRRTGKVKLLSAGAPPSLAHSTLDPRLLLLLPVAPRKRRF